MTRRERLEHRAERRRDWAESRDTRAAAARARAEGIASFIPPGQPILVGHHSEKRHRRDLDRMDNAMRETIASSDMAAHHRGAADTIEHQLKHSIFSDDEDAPEALTKRIAELEAKRDRYKAENAAYKKGGAPFAALVGITLEQAAARRVTIEAGYSWCRKPHPAYELSNLAGNIGRLRKRLEAVTAQRARSERAEAAAGGVVVEGQEWVRVTFAEKPDRAVLEALRGAGFRWGGGSWVGERAKLPVEVSA